MFLTKKQICVCACVCHQVQYVDYGLVENIPVVHVYPILLCEDVPQLCMPFQLHNVNPVSLSVSTVCKDTDIL